MTDLEKRLLAKLPGEDTGITVHKTLCEICSRGCGINAFVKDGKVIKIEGIPNDPMGFGYLCQKGQGSRSYIYRKDRVLTPLRRTGPRGSGEFEPITWEEAYREIAEKLLRYKKESGPDSVVFFTGYTKWFRTMYRRFIYSFGSRNYCTDDSMCMTSGLIASKLNCGGRCRPDMRNSGVFLGWAFNKFYSGSIIETMRVQKLREENGLKVIIVDPRITPSTQKLADLHLRPRPGTDGALALGLAHLIIKWDKVDHDFISDHVYGYEEYAEYVSSFTPEQTQKLTGVPTEQIIECARMMTENGPMSIAESNSPLAHHYNGMQSYRAVLALAAITGNFDRKGGQIPTGFADSSMTGDHVLEEEFVYDAFPIRASTRVGQEKYPLFAELVEQGQDVDLARQIREKTPYPIRAIFALGMNHRMMPRSGDLEKAFDELEFFVDADLFLTDTAKFADIVLPSCSSFERATFRPYMNGKVTATKPAIAPLGQSKSDVDILCELAEVMDLPDPLLRSGYRKCINFLLTDVGITLEELEENPNAQVPIPGFANYRPGLNTKVGYTTLTTKYELKSALIEQRFAKYGLKPLPEYEANDLQYETEGYPLILVSGGRLPNCMHSRLHGSDWHRVQRREPMADIHPEDAAERGICQGDRIILKTPCGRLHLKANLTYTSLKGTVFLFQGYRTADAASVMPPVYDPYTGFGAVNSAHCQLEKEPDSEEATV